MFKFKVCPCQSGKNFQECCAPILSGVKLPSPGELMRSRYCALVEKDYAYFLRTERLMRASSLEELTQSQRGMQWVGLQVLREVSVSSDHAVVEFIASYKDKGIAGALHEISHFLLLDGRWVYVDVVANPPGGNQPCWCQSGKKYKRCCALK